MTNEELETLKRICDEAPCETWQVFDNGSYRKKINGYWYQWEVDTWFRDKFQEDSAQAPDALDSIKKSDINIIIKQAERIAEQEGIKHTFEREFKALARMYICMCNDVMEGKYESNTPEGMIYNESEWVETRWLDVTEPLFTTHKQALEKNNLEQQAKGVDEFTCELLGSFRSHIMRNTFIKASRGYIEQLRQQAEGE